MRAISLCAVLATALAGCATSTLPAALPQAPVVDYVPRLIDSACSWSKMILVAKDRMTDAQASALLKQANADALTMGYAKAVRKMFKGSGLDILTDDTAKQILAHDNAWSANCGKK